MSYGQIFLSRKYYIMHITYYIFGKLNNILSKPNEYKENKQGSLTSTTRTLIMEGDISSGHSEGKSGSPPLSVTLRSKSQRVKDSRGGSMSGYQMIVGKTRGEIKEGNRGE